MLKVELHAHTDADPADRVSHSIHELIDRASALGYHAMAITLHDRYFDPAPHEAYARERGVLLMPGIERTIDRRHILLINFPPECADVQSLDDIVALKARTGGLVVAPHAFYPTDTALNSLLDRYTALFDAVEVNALYTSTLDFNRRAIEWAKVNNKPLVGNSDLHQLRQMGTTYSLVDAEPTPDAICHAIRSGRVTVKSTPLSSLRAGLIFLGMLWGGVRGRYRRSTV